MSAGLIGRFDLTRGSHNNPDEGLCLMELTAQFAGELHSDHPECVSPVLAAFGRTLNDALPDDLRQQLRPLVPALSGTAGDGWDERRRRIGLAWLVRVWLPAWQELLPVGFRSDMPQVDQLRRVMAAARPGCWDHAWFTAWDVAREFPESTLRGLQVAAVELFGEMVTVSGASAVVAPSGLLRQTAPVLGKVDVRVS